VRFEGKPPVLLAAGQMGLRQPLLKIEPESPLPNVRIATATAIEIDVTGRPQLSSWAIAIRHRTGLPTPISRRSPDRLKWVDLTHSLRRRGMAAFCANGTTGVDVKRTFQIATVDVAWGELGQNKGAARSLEAIRMRGNRCSQSQPDPVPHVRRHWAAPGQPFRKRLVSSKNRSQAGSCSRNKWFRPGKAMK
jgi:hypothetical protein